MVDFSLKLSDNKVSKWSLHYINYALLKTLLKKAKVHQTNRIAFERKLKVQEEKERRALRTGLLLLGVSGGNGNGSGYGSMTPAVLDSALNYDFSSNKSNSKAVSVKSNKKDSSDEEDENAALLVSSNSNKVEMGKSNWNEVWKLLGSRGGGGNNSKDEDEDDFDDVDGEITAFATSTGTTSVIKKDKSDKTNTNEQDQQQQTRVHVPFDKDDYEVIRPLTPITETSRPSSIIASHRELSSASASQPSPDVSITSLSPSTSASVSTSAKASPLLAPPQMGFTTLLDTLSKGTPRSSATPTAISPPSSAASSSAAAAAADALYQRPSYLQSLQTQLTTLRSLEESSWAAFNSALDNESLRVQSFYTKKVEEYGGRLDVLIEAVELGRSGGSAYISEYGKDGSGSSADSRGYGDADADGDIEANDDHDEQQRQLLMHKRRVSLNRRSNSSSPSKRHSDPNIRIGVKRSGSLSEGDYDMSVDNLDDLTGLPSKFASSNSAFDDIDRHSSKRNTGRSNNNKLTVDSLSKGRISSRFSVAEVVGALRRRTSFGSGVASFNSGHGNGGSSSKRLQVTSNELTGNKDLDVLDSDDDDDNISSNTSTNTGNKTKKIKRTKQEQDLANLSAFKALLKSDSIKRAVLDLHRNATLLQNYTIMNYTGFIKIIKKHDKTIPSRKGSFKKLLEPLSFSVGSDVEELNLKLERSYADWFCDGNTTQARAQMLPKVGDGLQTDWSQLRLGYRLGASAVLMLWICWDCLWQTMRYSNPTIGGTVAFPVFRACGGLLLIHWCWGVSVFVWNRFRINYIYLFEFDPRHVRTPLGIFNDAVDETLVFLVLMLLYYKSGLHTIPEILPSGAYPVLLVIYTIKQLFTPWKTRKNLFSTILNALLSPLYPATFFGTYVADVITSMIKILQDWAWTLSYIFSGDFLQKSHHYNKSKGEHFQSSFAYTNVIIPLICLLPIWIRLMQCLRRFADTGMRWPNLANAFKYTLSQTVTLFGTFHPLYMYHNKQHLTVTALIGHDVDTSPFTEVHAPMDLYQYFWIGLFVTSSLFSFTWDVTMDWGLGRPSYNFLGPRLMFPHYEWYYCAIVCDVFLRFLWVTSLVPPDSGAHFAIPNYLTALVILCEIIRRTIWGFLRLEQEHRHNTQGYRRVDFVPLHFNTGHDHKYKGEGFQRGNGVLMEVVTVGLAVVALSVGSIVSARRAAGEERF